MPNITVNTTLSLGDGQYQTLNQQRDIPSMTKAVEAMDMARKQFGSLKLPGVNTALRVVLFEGETEEQLSASVEKHGMTFSKFTGKRGPYYLVHAPKGAGAQNTGSFE